NSGRVSIEPADVDEATSWRNGQAVFRDERLADAIAEMNRYTEVKIVVVSPTIQDLKISGVFRTDRQDNFVAALTAFYPIVADRQSPGIIALKWRDSGGKAAATGDM